MRLLIRFKQLREGAFEHVFAGVFIEFGDGRYLRERATSLFECVCNNTGSVPLPDARTRIDSIESKILPHPALSEQPRLLFTERGKLVVVFLEKGSLRVANEEKAAHGVIGC